MSTLETNSIAKYSGNNVAIDDSLNLKSYTTTQRDALTSAAGDIIYNSTTVKFKFYNGSSWADTGTAFEARIFRLLLEVEVVELLHLELRGPWWWRWSWWYLANSSLLKHLVVVIQLVKYF